MGFFAYFKLNLFSFIAFERWHLLSFHVYIVKASLRVKLFQISMFNSLKDTYSANLKEQLFFKTKNSKQQMRSLNITVLSLEFWRDVKT